MGHNQNSYTPSIFISVKAGERIRTPDRLITNNPVAENETSSIKAF